MSFTLQLRTTAAGHPDVLRKKLLRDAADAIDNARRAFELVPDSETLRELNGAWARANRQLMLAENALSTVAPA